MLFNKVKIVAHFEEYKGHTVNVTRIVEPYVHEDKCHVAFLNSDKSDLPVTELHPRVTMANGIQTTYWERKTSEGKTIQTFGNHEITYKSFYPGEFLPYEIIRTVNN